MNRKYFGTDGIRGLTNSTALTAEIAMKAGMAAGRIFTRGDHRHRVVIGKDTRLSGYMIESALVAGFTSVGMDVFQFGPLPTPAVAMLTRSLRADIGVMITASHNKYQDNGIKFFGPDGQKLSDAREAEIEALMMGGLEQGLVPAAQIGRAKRIDDSQARYIEFAKQTFPRNLRLDGLRIVIDCANGAAYKVAPAVLWELGADIVAIGVDPDGRNINQDCGSTAPQALMAKVREVRADFGIALDGDADRVLMTDEQGHILDGDQILALIARSWSKSRRLKGGGVVGTVMSNAGLDRYLQTLDLKLARAAVGDRYVLEEMRKGGFNVGGEQSGHIILSDFSTTGDGLIAALQVLAVLATEGKPASEAAHLFEPLPQVLENVRFRKGAPLEDARVKSSIDAANARLGASGRILVRKSGTEPLIRVMAEGEDEKLVRAVVRDIASAIEEAAASLFRGTDLLDGLTTVFSPADAWREAQRRGTLWVCDDGGEIVGFLAATASDEGLHIDELDVAPTHQRRGAGRTLIETAIAWARAGGSPAVTLTTFREAPWNAPFYARLGFVEIAPDRIPPSLASKLAAETRAGLPAARRCAMVLRLGGR